MTTGTFTDNNLINELMFLFKSGFKQQVLMIILIISYRLSF